jgi:L-glutamine-phosphate cytidylyltransferase
MTRAIIIAAGMGSRLEHHTDDRPKCMVEVGGGSILSHQIRAFSENGVDDLHIIRGYLSEKLVVEGATYYENENFRNNNILFSLFCAEEAMEDSFLTTYSDIVYTPDVVRRTLASPYDVALVIDRCWADAYEGRDDHPVEQAELAEVEDGRVLRVGKQVGPEKAAGEFIGLAKFSARGGALLRETFHDVRSRIGDDDQFQAAALFRKSYLTDLFLEMIDRGAHIGWVPIDGEWREIDTVEDLERVNAFWSSLA